MQSGGLILCDLRALHDIACDTNHSSYQGCEAGDTIGFDGTANFILPPSDELPRSCHELEYTEQHLLGILLITLYCSCSSPSWLTYRNTHPLMYTGQDFAKVSRYCLISRKRLASYLMVAGDTLVIVEELSQEHMPRHQHSTKHPIYKIL